MSEEFWYEQLDPFSEEGRFIVCDIDKDDLDDENEDGIRLLGGVELGDWDGLAKILNEEEAKLHKMDFASVSSYVVALYCEGNYVTTIQGSDED